MAEDRPDVYEEIGTYSNDDARILLDAFVAAGISYTADVDKKGMENMPPFLAAFGGTFGTGVGIAIRVHVDDLEDAMKIRQRVFKIAP